MNSAYFANGEGGYVEHNYGAGGEALPVNAGDVDAGYEPGSHGNVILPQDLLGQLLVVCPLLPEAERSKGATLSASYRNYTILGPILELGAVGGRRDSSWDSERQVGGESHGLVGGGHV